MCSFKLKDNLYIIFQTRFNRDLNDSVDDNDTKFMIQTNIRLLLFIL